MSDTVDNKGKAIATSGTKHKAIAPAPKDKYRVLKTGAEIPVENVAPTTNLGKGATEFTKIAGKTIWTERGLLDKGKPFPSGPGPGVPKSEAIGATSQGYRGPARAQARGGSDNCMIEGHPVVRTGDRTEQNLKRADVGEVGNCEGLVDGSLLGDNLVTDLDWLVQCCKVVELKGKCHHGGRSFGYPRGVGEAERKAGKEPYYLEVVLPTETDPEKVTIDVVLRKHLVDGGAAFQCDKRHPHWSFAADHDPLHPAHSCRASVGMPIDPSGMTTLEIVPECVLDKGMQGWRAKIRREQAIKAGGLNEKNKPKPKNSPTSRLDKEVQKDNVTAAEAKNILAKAKALEMLAENIDNFAALVDWEYRPHLLRGNVTACAGTRPIVIACFPQGLFEASLWSKSLSEKFFNWIEGPAMKLLEAFEKTSVECSITFLDQVELRGGVEFKELREASAAPSAPAAAPGAASGAGEGAREADAGADPAQYDDLARKMTEQEKLSQQLFGGGEYSEAGLARYNELTREIDAAPVDDRVAARAISEGDLLTEQMVEADRLLYETDFSGENFDRWVELNEEIDGAPLDQRVQARERAEAIRTDQDRLKRLEQTLRDLERFDELAREYLDHLVEGGDPYDFAGGRELHQLTVRLEIPGGLYPCDDINELRRAIITTSGRAEATVRDADELQQKLFDATRNLGIEHQFPDEGLASCHVGKSVKLALVADPVLSIKAEKKINLILHLGALFGPGGHMLALTLKTLLDAQTGLKFNAQFNFAVKEISVNWTERGKVTAKGGVNLTLGFHLGGYISAKRAGAAVELDIVAGIRASVDFKLGAPKKKTDWVSFQKKWTILVGVESSAAIDFWGYRKDKTKLISEWRPWIGDNDYTPMTLFNEG